MRLILTALVVVPLFAASAGAAQAPTVSVSVTASAPTSPSGSRSPRGRRTYSVSFRVSVGSDQECQNLSVTYSYASRFDGRPSFAGSGEDFYETNQPASSASFAVHAEGDAADIVSFSAYGECEDADGNVIGSSAPVAANVRVPAYSCEQGPLRVLVSRNARREDLIASGSRVPVRAGHYLWTGYHVWLGRRGRLTYGAPECHGLRTTVTGPASFVPGEYARTGEGSPTVLGFDAVADVHGDQHSGGVVTDNAVALPLGKRAGPSAPARFEVVSYAKKRGRVTRVRVGRGRVYVAGRTGRGKYGVPLIA